MVTKFVPEAGDLVWVDFTPSAGHEQSGRRPALVLSPSAYNRKTSLAIVAPITSQRKGYSFEVELPKTSKIGGVVLADHLRSIDWRRRQATYAGRAPTDVVAGVQERIALLLGLETS